MRNLLILPIVFMSFMADFGAFAATARNVRGGANNAGNTGGDAPVAARAAIRGGGQSVTTGIKSVAPVAARAAQRNTPKTAQPAVSGAVAARAGAKKSAINLGTKVAAATTNTVVSQDCQDAFFGCMDSFCMLENVAGGRCKCSKRNEKYDAMLAEIMELDQQSYVMQTEGVSWLKMGNSADEVYARAEEAAKRVVKEKEEAKQTTNSNSLSINTSFFDDDSEFYEDDMILPSDLSSRTGESLLAAAVGVCSPKVPQQCRDSVSVLRLMYTSKIESDCAAYDNSLAQQKLESEQKLQAANQALLAASLEKYQEENKYDLGGCVIEYAKCMQKEEVCGEGYANCVTLAATENVQNNRSGPKAAQRTVASIAPVTNVTGTKRFSTKSGISLSVSTIDQLNAKRVLCDSVLNQCVNVKDDVWANFLNSAAVEIKVAESESEDKLRKSCTKDVSECFQTACKEQMDPNNPDGSYDACLTNPEVFKSLCKVKLEPCLIATGSSYDNPSGVWWDGLIASLTSMKVDACTNQIRDCLLSEDRCGKDYAGCLGLSTEDIGYICPFEKLTACMSDKKTDEDEVRKYVAKVAQGIALKVDNSFFTLCNSALKTAMVTFCGDESSCPNANVDENMFKDTMSVQMCLRQDSDDSDKVTYNKCSKDVYSFGDQDLVDGKVVALLRDKVDISAIEYVLDNSDEIYRDDKGNTVYKTLAQLADGGKYPFDENKNDKISDDSYNDDMLKRTIRTLNSKFTSIVNSIESDPKIVYCTTGRQVKGFDDKWIGKRSSDNTAKGSGGSSRFPNLTKNIRTIIAGELAAAMSPVYFDTEQQVIDEQFVSVTKALSDRINEIVKLAQDEQDRYNLQACTSLNKSGSEPNCHGCRYNEYKRVATYDSNTAMCKVDYTHWHRKYCGCAAKFQKKEETRTFVLPKINRSNINDIKKQDDIESEYLKGAKSQNSYSSVFD